MNNDQLACSTQDISSCASMTVAGDSNGPVICSKSVQ
jgi:hypothetical protein